RVPVPLTLSDSDERLKAAPAPSVAEFASPANAGVAPPPVGGGEGAGVDGAGVGVDGAGVGVDGAGVGVDGAGVGVDGSDVGDDGVDVAPPPVDGGEGADAGALSVLQAIAVSMSASATKRVGPFMTLDT